MSEILSNFISVDIFLLALEILIHPISLNFNFHNDEIKILTLIMDVWLSELMNKSEISKVVSFLLKINVVFIDQWIKYNQKHIQSRLIHD